MILYDAAGTPLHLDTSNLGAGGFGAIHRFDRTLHPDKRLRVAKLYKNLTPADRAAIAGYQPKVQYLVDHIPDTRHLPNPDCLAWPEQLLFDDTGAFVGCVLPLVSGAVQVKELCTPTGNVDPKFDPFQGPDPEPFKARLGVALNLVTTMQAFEALGDYVNPDHKDQNLMVNPAGLVYLIDLDGIQIKPQGRMLFPADATSAEWVPPEWLDPATGFILPGALTDVAASWQHWATAVMLYQLLFNINPYSGCIPPGDPVLNRKQGLFLNGRHRARFRSVAREHDAFRNVSSEVQKLFLAAFDLGHDDPSLRPAATQWAEAFQAMGAVAGKVTAHQRRTIGAARRIPQVVVQAQPGVGSTPHTPAPPLYPPAAIPAYHNTGPNAQTMNRIYNVLAARRARAHSARSQGAPAPGGIWGSVEERPPHTVPDVFEDPGTEHTQLVELERLSLMLLVTTTVLVCQTTEGDLPIGKRVELSYVHAGPGDLQCNFGSDATPDRILHRLLSPQGHLLGSGTFTRDIYSDYTFRLWARCPHATKPGKQETLELAIPVWVSRPPFRTPISLAPNLVRILDPTVLREHLVRILAPFKPLREPAPLQAKVLPLTGPPPPPLHPVRRLVPGRVTLATTHLRGLRRPTVPLRRKLPPLRTPTRLHPPNTFLKEPIHEPDQWLQTRLRSWLRRRDREQG